MKIANARISVSRSNKFNGVKKIMCFYLKDGHTDMSKHFFIQEKVIKSVSPVL